MRLRPLVLALVPLALAGCALPEDAPVDPRPDIFVVIWDTARSDRMSLYGHARETTPAVDGWAAGARVFEDCLSVSSTTVPSHASLFTGLMPGEHGAHNTQPRLADGIETLAERLAARGYRSYLFSANPFVSEATGLARGFETVEHPWDERHRAAARAITARKIESAGGQSLVGKGRARAEGARWGLGSAGALTLPALLEWLDGVDDQPVFVVLNYMEAHQPLLPDPAYQVRAMDPATRAIWRASDRTFERMRAFTFGLTEIPEPELDALAAAYDAALMELDAHFDALLAALGGLERARERVLVLTSDHGEHLGEHHLLDHQFSLHEPLLRVPLVVEAPGIEPGRDGSPVSLIDLHPALLRVAGDPGEAPSSAFPRVPLGAAPEGRARLAEYPAAPEKQIAPFARAYPAWDPEPWRRGWRSIQEGPWKLRAASDGESLLHDLGSDPGELVDLSAEHPDRLERLSEMLEAFVGAFRGAAPSGGDAELPEELRERLESLGYAGGGA